VVSPQGGLRRCRGRSRGGILVVPVQQRGHEILSVIDFRGRLAMEPLTVFVESSGVRDLVFVCGELDLASAASIESLLLDRAAAGRHLTLDLSLLTFCGSIGFALLIELQRRAVGEGGSLRLVGVPAYLSRIMSLIGVDSVLGVAGSVAAL
jgi:anti-sigma B factor antagonist